VANQESAPPGVDITRPSIARVYDYMIGGKDNFAVDRIACEAALQITPDGAASGRANRAFLRRLVRYLVGTVGIKQFLDIGSGLPTNGNVHQIAHEIDPTVRVVYVDNDPMVLAHGRALLSSAGTTAVVQADVRDPDDILGDRDIHKLIDFDQPVGLLLVAILHHLHDHEDPAGLAGRYRDAIAPGSYLGISHFHNPGQALPEVAREASAVERAFNKTLGTGRWRSRDEIVEYFGNFEILEPGVVPVAEWRPEPGEVHALQTHTYHTIVGGLGRKA
jgi:hypothetical protein